MSNFNADELKRKLGEVVLESKLFSEAELKIILSGQFTGSESAPKQPVDRRIGVYFLRNAEDKFCGLRLPYSARVCGSTAGRDDGAHDDGGGGAGSRGVGQRAAPGKAEHGDPGGGAPGLLSSRHLPARWRWRVRMAHRSVWPPLASAAMAARRIAPRTWSPGSAQGVPFGRGSRSGDPSGFNSPTLVIGGGIAGIQAALEIAESGNKVYLVERTGTIGGRMAMFDKTFPTLDCAACILTPKMVAVGQSIRISKSWCSPKYRRLRAASATSR